MSPGRSRTTSSEVAHAALLQLIDAIAFAAHKHRDQRRKNARASPYINHPIELARVLALEAGITFGERGRSSLRYEIGIFLKGGETTVAHGHFIHVYVDAATRRPIPLPESLAAAVARFG